MPKHYGNDALGRALRGGMGHPRLPKQPAIKRGAPGGKAGGAPQVSRDRLKAVTRTTPGGQKVFDTRINRSQIATPSQAARNVAAPAPKVEYTINPFRAIEIAKNPNLKFGFDR